MAVSRQHAVQRGETTQIRVYNDTIFDGEKYQKIVIEFRGEEERRKTDIRNPFIQKKLMKIVTDDNKTTSKLQ